MEIPEDQKQRLLTALEMEPHGDLPEKVQQTYWRVKRVIDRLGVPFSDYALLSVILLSGLVSADPPKPKLDVRSFKDGDKIKVMWRSKSIEAIFRRMRGDRLLVEIGGEERIIDAERVLGEHDQ